MSFNHKLVRLIDKYLDSMYGDFIIKTSSNGDMKIYDRYGDIIFSVKKRYNVYYGYVRSDVTGTLRRLFDISLWDEDWYLSEIFKIRFNVKTELNYVM